MIITIWHTDGTAFSIRRSVHFNVESWFEDNRANFVLLGVAGIEYELV